MSENNNYIKLIFEDIKRIFNSLDIGQKFGLITLITITLIASTYFVFKMTQPNWSVLYSDLSPQDAMSVIEGLKKGGYTYKVSSDKTAILVPQNLQDDLRVYVAENNLIQDSSHGFELLDEMQLGSTDFKNELTKQRIYQGELTRSIEKMYGIKKARVQLAQPERSIFTDKDEIPSASVMLILEGGYKLKSSQIKAIKNLVAYSIPRMKPEMVFITDQSGNTLTDDVTKNSSDIETFKYNYEKQTASKVQNILERIVGRGNITVSVSCDIDFNSTKATIESYIPVSDDKTGVLASTQSESEIYEKPLDDIKKDNESENENNETNIQNQQIETNAEIKEEENEKPRNLNYQKNKIQSHYNVSKEVKQIVYAPGSVKRMTIAVAVNKILTSEEKKELHDLILSASGADEKRGDIISISSMQFLSLDEEMKRNEELQKEIKQDTIMHIVFNKVAPLIVVLVLGLTSLIVFKSVFGKVFALRSGENSPDNTSWSSDSEVQYQHSLQDSLDDMIDVDELPQIEAKLDPEIDQKRSELSETILSDPQEATRLLVSYIRD